METYPYIGIELYFHLLSCHVIWEMRKKRCAISHICIFMSRDHALAFDDHKMICLLDIEELQYKNISEKQDTLCTIAIQEYLWYNYHIRFVRSVQHFSSYRKLNY